MKYTRFTNCHLIDNGITYYNTDLFIDNTAGTIINDPHDDANTKIIDLHGKYLAPGLIDIQNNGFFGLNFSDLHGDSRDEIDAYKRKYDQVMMQFLETGVTSVCPTITSNYPEVYEKVLPIVGKSRHDYKTDSLGAHCEGPFISLLKKGCHPTETFVDAHEGHTKIDQVYGGPQNLLDNVTIVTAAPEVPGILDIIPYLKLKNIIYSIGHTNADYATGLKAIDQGATMITHLYNAMPQPHHRDPGVIGLINTPIPNDTPYFGMICDGIHVDASMASLAYKSHPNKCVLTTDAIFMFGLKDGLYKWDKRNIVKQGFRLCLEGTKTLAGSGTSLIQCVRNLIKWTNISLAEAIKTATNNAANSLNLQHQKGFLNVGCDADLIVLDDQCFIHAIYKLGKSIRVNDESQPGKLMANL